MTFLTGLAFFVFMIVVVFTPLFGLYYLIKYVFNFLFENSFNSTIDINYAEIVLSSKFDYYQRLSIPNKKKFLKRLNAFINNKQFISSGNHQLTEEMEVLIAASAIQLTFGLEGYLLDSFTKIFIYPKEFYSKVGKNYHKGETNLAGAIALSWKHFADGYSNASDKINLGLHEMAHALRFDKFKSDDYDRFFNQYFDKYQIVASKEYHNLKEQKPSFFRSYGGANFHEFFAVSIEHFFESPREFKEQHPDIYMHLCILMNQNPLDLYYDNPRARLMDQISNVPIQLKGVPFYQSGIKAKHLLALALVFFIWLMVVVANIQDGITSNEIVTLFIILVIGYFTSVRAYSRILFYENGVEIKYSIPTFWSTLYLIGYDQLICVEFFEKDIDELTDGISITYIENGKIKTKSYTDTFSGNEVIRLADLIVSKKVAVKLNTFIRYK